MIFMETEEDLDSYVLKGFKIIDKSCKWEESEKCVLFLVQVKLCSIWPSRKTNKVVLVISLPTKKSLQFSRVLLLFFFWQHVA